MFKSSSTASRLMVLMAEGLTKTDIVDLIRSVSPDERVRAVEELATAAAEEAS